MFDLLIELLSYGFMQRALLVGVLVAICSSFLGTFLVLKKYSMIGDGLAHVSFASVALALLLGLAPLIVSIPIVIMASFLIFKLNEKAELHGDAAIGLISSFSVAAGVLIAKVGDGFNVDLFTYLFGSILTIKQIDVYLSILLSVVVIVSIIMFYNTLFSITYDEEFEKVNGTNTTFTNYLISVLTSITIVLGIRVVGTMLISSMIIFPTVSALQVSKGFKQTILISTINSVSCVILGILTSIIFDLPPGATIVLLNGIVFVGFYLIRKIRS
jgi:zinc transport system permease protein